MIKEIKISSEKRNEMIDVTRQIQSIVLNSGIREGCCIVYCPHTTAAVTINENADPNVQKDFLNTLSKLVPENASYAHAEGNADSHIKSSIIGNSRAILVKNGKLLLGAWEGCFFVEADGPRNRKLFVKILKS